jgi:hypothetical protein
VASDQDYEVSQLAQKHDQQQARDLIARVGNDREKLLLFALTCVRWVLWLLDREGGTELHQHRQLERRTILKSHHRTGRARRPFPANL